MATTQYKRIVRKEPLMQRIKSYLDPIDFLLWISEELESSDWDQLVNEWAIPLGFMLNLVMLIARANSVGSSEEYDDVFAERKGGVLGWVASLLVFSLTGLSLVNAAYAFYRTRRYRLFEASVDAAPSTPSAQRVRVESSPAVASSPLSYLSKIRGASAESRAHPDPSKDVWEISVWDPTPLCLRMFCLFSPGHVLIYWLFLPVSSHDAHPSTTVVLTISLILVLSSQLYYLQSCFLQQSKDMSLINREVLNEYNIKYVHPRTRPVMRDAAVQCRDLGLKTGPSSEIDLYQPVTVVNRGFQTNPNNNYIKHFDPDASSARQTPSRESSWIMDNTPNLRPLSDTTTPIRQSSPLRSSQARHSMGPRIGDGGSLGVYTHDRSPLKKAASQNLLNQRLKHRGGQ